jgi:pilus assembly protein FimV
MKLLEIYAARPDKTSFERVARELHAAFDGKGQLWAKAAAMGQALDPGNPLYETMESAALAAAPVRPAEGIIDIEQELMGIQQAKVPEERPKQDLMASLAPQFETGQPTEPEPLAGEDALRAALFGTETPTEEEAKPAPSVAENMLDFDLDSLASEPVPQAKAEPESAPKAAESNMIDFAFSLESLGQEAAKSEQATEAPKPAEPENSLEFESPLGDFAALYEGEPEEPLSTSGLAVSDDPLSTKLDLAKVYLDMGDSDGAKEVLKELLEEAQGKLKEEAQALLAKLGG